MIMLVAYGAGLGLILWRVEADEARNTARQGGEPVPSYLRVPGLLAWCVPERADWIYAFYRYPSWERTDPGFYEPVILVVLACTSLGLLASVWIPAGAALPHLRGVPSGERWRAGRVWRAMLHCPPPRTVPRWLWMAAAGVGGFSVPIFSDAWAMIVGPLRLKAALETGSPGRVGFIEPVLGSLALPDAIAMIAWAMVVPLGLVWITTSKAFMAREGRVGGRCLACGYPKATRDHEKTGGVAEAVGASLCTECGTRFIRTIPTTHVRGLRFRIAVVLGGVLVLSLIAFCFAPRLTG